MSSYKMICGFNKKEGMRRGEDGNKAPLRRAVEEKSLADRLH
jgi:hypothetical protein